jgi:hypothetical protein
MDGHASFLGGWTESRLQAGSPSTAGQALRPGDPRSPARVLARGPTGCGSNLGDIRRLNKTGAVAAGAAAGWPVSPGRR